MSKDQGIRGGQITIISAICGLEWIVLIQCLNPSSYGVANDWIWVFNSSPSEADGGEIPDSILHAATLNVDAVLIRWCDSNLGMRQKPAIDEW